MAAAQEERFSRQKDDPLSAGRGAIASRRGLTIADIDCVAYYEDPTRSWSGSCGFGSRGLAGGAAELGRFDPFRPLRDVHYQLGYSGKVRASITICPTPPAAYYFSGFPDAAILTVDGVGEWATATYGRGRGLEVSLFQEVRFPNSLGLLYSTVTAYLGFEVNDGEYKVMGLAPYGEPRTSTRCGGLDASPRWRGPARPAVLRFHRNETHVHGALCSLLGNPPRPAGVEARKFPLRCGASLQQFWRSVCSRCAGTCIFELQREPLLAGGVALNCVANSRMLREGPFKRLFVQPAAGDAGGCLGAAALAHVRLTGGAPRRNGSSTFSWGRVAMQARSPPS